MVDELNVAIRRLAHPDRSNRTTAAADVEFNGPAPE
jgi:hypothetical protein